MSKKNWGAYIYVAVLACLVAGGGTYIWEMDRDHAENKPGQVYYLDEYFEAEKSPVPEVHVVDEKDVLLEKMPVDSEEGSKNSELDSLVEGEDTVKAEFLLRLVNGHVTVYRLENLSESYMSTGISMEELPEETLKEIEAGKEIQDEEALYFFLESYSS